MWLAPVQAVVATIVSDADDYARELVAKLQAPASAPSSTCATRRSTTRCASTPRKVPVMLVVGKREAEEGTVSIRRLGSEERQLVMTLDEAMSMIVEEAIAPDLSDQRGRTRFRLRHAVE